MGCIYWSYSNKQENYKKTTVGTEGKAMDDDTVQFKTNWLYQNVVEVGPNK